MALGFVAALIISAAPPAAAEPVPGRPNDQTIQRVQTYLDQQVADNGWPGASLAVVHGQSVVALHTTGKADDHGRALTPDTPVLLASVTKSVTAVAIMQLVDSGKVRLDAPVVTYLPWFRTRDKAASDTITVAQLLQHTSGLGTNPRGEQDRLRHSEPAELERGIRDLAAADLVSVPGKEFRYANANYDVLGMIIQTVSGQPFATYVEQNVFAAIGMSHSFVGKDQAPAHQAAAGYRPTDTPLRGVFAPSAGGYSSASDLARFLIMEMNGGTIDGKRVLSTASVDQMHRPAVAENDFTGYAMGWRVRPGWEYLRPAEQTASDRLPLLLEHAGSWPNTTTYVGFQPEAKLGFAVLVNGNEPDQSRLTALGPNIWRLLAGQEPTASGGQGRWLEVHGWQVGAAVIILLLASLVVSVVLITRRRTVRARWVFLGHALIIDAIVLIFVLGYVPRTFDTPALAISQLNPDLGIELLAVLALTVLWAPIRTLLLIRRAMITRRPARSADHPPEPAPLESPTT